MKRKIRGLTLLLAALAIFACGPAFAAEAATATFAPYLNVSALQAGQTAVVAIVVNIAPGLHAQSHQPLEKYLIPLQVQPDANPDIEFLAPVYPPPTVVRFAQLGSQSVYTGQIIIYLPMRIKAAASPGATTISGKLTWQACNDQACFPPETDQPFSIKTQIVPATQPVELENQAWFAQFDQRVFSGGAALAPVPAAAAFDFFGHGFEIPASNLLLIMSIALLVGILFNLMPCVLPVVPLKAIGFFEVSRHNRGRCLLLGAVFSLGVISVFVVLAILIVALRASLHFSWGEQFKYGWFIWSIVAILTVMALGMFGLFDVVLPDAVYRITPSHESIWGNFVFGMLAAVLSTPCTAPMFAGILAWAVAESRGLGISAVIMVGVGMALPYLLLSAFPSLGRWVPRTGAWSAVLKQMMGFLLLAVAVYFAGGRLASNKEFFWFVLAVVAAAMAFLVIRTVQLSIPTILACWRTRGITRGMVSLVIRTIQFSWTGKGIWPIYASLTTAMVVIWLGLSITLGLTGGLEWKPYSWKDLVEARKSGRPVLVEFTANWCGNCLALEATVYHDRQTAAAMRRDNVILLRADLTAQDAPGWTVVNQLNPGGGIPLTAIYGPYADHPIKLTSLYTAQNLIDALDRAQGGQK